MNTISGVLHAARLGVLTCMFVGCAGACLGQSGETQQQVELKGLLEDVSTLKNDVRILGQRLQQVMQKLDELTKPPRASLDTPPLTMHNLENIRGFPFRGNDSATVVIIEYMDFECPFCAKFWKETYPQILANYVKTGKLKYVYRDFPLQMHSHSMRAARAAYCAGEQDKLWELRDNLLADQEALLVGDA
jgi:protein-disulfide isomerase